MARAIVAILTLGGNAFLMYYCLSINLTTFSAIRSSNSRALGFICHELHEFSLIF